MTREDKEKFLTRIPFLGYFFRKIKKNKRAIEKALDTGEKIEGEITTKEYLYGVIKVITYKTFDTLKLKRR